MIHHMTGTHVLPAAYDDGMEPILLLLLLTSMQQGGDLNAALQKFLTFWRENRELIMLLTRGAPADAAQKAPDRAPDKKEDRPPQEDSPIVSVLEEYLKNSAGR